MNKDKVIEIQNRILDLAPNRSGLYLKYCCSELSRLIIKWLFDYDKNYKFYILKAENVIGSQIAHDILVIKNNETYSIIDSTIWQFFPEANSILVYEGNDIKEAISSLNQKYKCNWLLGEQEQVPGAKTEQEYMNIVKDIIKDNIAEFGL
jgi:hypothetical protein